MDKTLCPPTDDRDLTMGRFMDAWSSLENKLFLFFWKLTKTNFYIARAIYSTGIQAKNLTELLISIAPHRLTDTEQKMLKTLCRRYYTFSLKRNRIVHGAWKIEIKADKSQWLRSYSPISYQLWAEMHHPQNQKIRRAYCFTIKQLAEATEQIKILHKDYDCLIYPFLDRLDVEDQQEYLEQQQLLQKLRE